MMKYLVAGALALALAASPAAAKTLVFCSEGSPEALNPQIVTTTTGMNAGRPMFNNLVEFVPGTTQIVPALAESWEISPDGTTYTFHLRRGVKFHANAVFTPTRDFNADDVLFSLMRQWKEDHPFHGTPGATFDYFRDLGMPDLIRAIEKVDDHTVRISLARAEAPFLANLAMPFNVMLSAEYGELLLRRGEPARLDADPVGTGPFALVGYQKDIAIRYRAFADHWNGRQKIDTLVFSITPNPAVRLAKLKAGECHIMAFPNPSDREAIAANPSLRLLQQEGLNIGYLAMNAARPPFDNVELRRAVNMAIDKRAIIEAVHQGTGTVAKNPIPPLLWSYNEAIEDYPYDPAQARRLIAEAGYPDGLDTDLWYMPVNRPYNPDGRRVAELVQADLARIGMRTRLVTEEWDQYRVKLQAGEPPLALYGWTGDNGDPDNFLNVLLGCAAARPGGNNVAKWCLPEYDALVTRAKATSDRSERETLYRQAQEIFKREAPWVPLAHSIVFMATRKEVKGFGIDPLGRHVFEGVDLDGEASR
ncbi:dipeptide transport system substrate-binding protein [Chelatococcus caeni]|uniref:Dipeptide transport system substrate-binding protein n=2 Tax=Chelatococcus TaxID=28209 RepID=A0A840C056_9HYPH|nr:ABC transporter substrate-binding protein [Chelatococcus caeni]MBB4018955.1 dipeptide transport system substrate-binding protein [Chelatococcus caeni]